MSATQSDHAAQIINTLRVTDPELDTATGSTTRKIIDAVAEALAEVSIDQHLTSYTYDIEAKIDADLDDFVQMFGMARYAAKRASGQVTLVRSSGSDTTLSVFVPVGTEIESFSGSVVVRTVSSAWIAPGALSVTVPVVAAEAGLEGNLAAGALGTLRSALLGVDTATNVRPLSGGASQESDAELRERWKRTVFRSLAGTEQMYLGVALDDPDCYAANAIGASKRRREQVQVTGATVATTVDDAKYVLREPVFVGANIDAGDLLIPGADYTWNYAANPPTLTLTNHTSMLGSIVEVDFEYIPQDSRNEPDSAIFNRIDIWLGGARAQAGAQSLAFSDALRFNTTAGSAMHTSNFVRTDGSHPTSGNVFVPLAWGPIISVPTTLSSGGRVYALATAENPMGTTSIVGGETLHHAYRLVHDDTAFGYTATSRFGLEWYYSNATGTVPVGMNYRPSNGQVLNIGSDESGTPYVYNAMIGDVQQALERWRLLGVDAKVHQARPIELRLSIALMYDPGAVREVVNEGIDKALAEHMSTRGFQGRIQASDLIQVIHNVPGVDNVRFLNASDYVGYVPANANTYNVGVQRVIEGVVTRSYVDSAGRVQELRFGDGELPVFHSVVKVVKAENSFGAL